MSARAINPANGSTIRVVAGERLEIALPENPTTGYLWHVDGLPASLRPEQPSNFEAQETAVGAGGTRVFTFRAVEPFDGEVVFVLRRVRGPSVAEERIFAVTVSRPQR